MAENPLRDELEHLAGHLRLLPGAVGRGDGERPENEEADGSGGGLVEPLAGADFHFQLAVLVPQHHVQGGGHAGELPPAALLLDLQERGAVFRLKSLAVEALPQEPGIQVAGQLSKDQVGCGELSGRGHGSSRKEAVNWCGTRGTGRCRSIVGIIRPMDCEVKEERRRCLRCVG